MSKKLTKEQASKLIADKMSQINGLLTECEEISTENDVEFYMSIGVYGMGGRHDPKDGWEASSQSC